MSRALVTVLLDPLHPITSSDTQFDGSIREIRSLDLPFCTFVKDRIQSIEANFRVKNVLFEDENVFQIDSRDLLVRFEKVYGEPRYAFGTVLFYDRSISAGGFYDPKRGYFGRYSGNWQDERTIAVSVEHAFQTLLSHLKIINISTKKKQTSKSLIVFWYSSTMNVLFLSISDEICILTR